MRQGVLLIIIFILPFCLGLTSQNTATELESPYSSHSDIPIYNFDALEPLLYTDSDKTYIVNFWAMWCAPCVKELPLFEEYKEKYPDAEVLLVSMDFPEDIETKLKPFLKKRGITLQVALLDDPDANAWIDKVDPNWSGAIPFTIIFDKNNRSFHERPFKDIQDLEQEINITTKNQ